jgi:hypothetical protein
VLRKQKGIVLTAALSALLAAPGIAQAADLVTSSASTQRYGHPGGQIGATATVRARSAVHAASQLRFYLSTNRTWDSKDVRLAGSAKVPRLKAGRRHRAAAIVTIPSTAPVASYYLLACADDLHRVRETNERNNCAASARKVDVTAQPVTSRSLIDAALAAGTIKEETALLYRVYAAFGDRRLPARYVGDGASVGDDAVLTDVHTRWGTLGAVTRAKLKPFFLPPAARGSWYDRSRARKTAQADPSGAPAADEPCQSNHFDNPNWTSITAAGGKVRIWWWKSDPINHQVALSVQRWVGIAYPKFKKVMGLEPISDEGTLCFHGPDGALDIYLVAYISDPNGPFLSWTKGLTNPYPPWCSKTPTFITIQGYGGPPYFKVEIVATKFVVAHELFHAFQYAFQYKGACKDYNWFDEGAANWGANYAFPTDNTEHHWDSLITCPGSQLNGLSYATWPFDLYVEKVLGVSTIPAIYASFGSHAPVEGINAALPGGLQKRWPEFTRYGWNQDPITPSFGQWDDFNVIPEICLGGALPVASLDLLGKHQDVKDAPISGLETHPGEYFYGSMSPLSRRYDRFSVTDPNIRYLKFKNTLQGVQGAGVQAIVKFADGHQEVQDWTNRSSVEFCFDDKSGSSDDVTNLVVMYSNSNFVEFWDSANKHPLTVSEQPSLKFRDACETYTYKILNVSFSTHASGTQTGDVCSLGGLSSSGTRDFSGVMTAQPSPLVSKLEADNSGNLQGKIQATTSAKWTNDLVHSCKFDSNGDLVACDIVAPDHTPQPDGTWPVTYAIDFQPKSATLTGHWGINDPDIGWVSGGPDPNGCSVFGFGFAFPYAETAQSRPLTTFTNTGPQTISFSGSKHFELSQLGLTQTLDYSWSFSVTFVRVDENGNPL